MEELDKQLNKASEILDDFEKVNGIKTFGVPAAIEETLGLSYNQIEKLTAEQCAYYAYILSEYSLYIQRLQNTEITKEKWLNNKLLEFVAPKLDSYDKYAKYEVKLRLIAKENEAVAQIMRKINYVQLTIDRLNFISSHVKHLSDAMSNIQRVKTYKV